MYLQSRNLIIVRTTRLRSFSPDHYVNNGQLEISSIATCRIFHNIPNFLHSYNSYVASNMAKDEYAPLTEQTNSDESISLNDEVRYSNRKRLIV
jgi:hypothetical protein